MAELVSYETGLVSYYKTEMSHLLTEAKKEHYQSKFSMAQASIMQRHMKRTYFKMNCFKPRGVLTAVNAEMLLQMMLILEGFSTLGAFELSVSRPIIQQRRLWRRKGSFYF